MAATHKFRTYREMTLWLDSMGLYTKGRLFGLIFFKGGKHASAGVFKYTAVFLGPEERKQIQEPYVVTLD
jgi:hypothetical protein